MPFRLYFEEWLLIIGLRKITSGDKGLLYFLPRAFVIRAARGRLSETTAFWPAFIKRVAERKKLKLLKPCGRGAPRAALPSLTDVQDHRSNIHVVTTSEGRQLERCSVVTTLIAGCWIGFKPGKETDST